MQLNGLQIYHIFATITRKIQALFFNDKYSFVICIVQFFILFLLEYWAHSVILENRIPFNPFYA